MISLASSILRLGTSLTDAEHAEIRRRKLRAKEALKKSRWRARNPEKAREKERLRQQRRAARTKPQREAASLASRIERHALSIATKAEREEIKRLEREARRAVREALSPEQLRSYRLAQRRKPDFQTKANAQKRRWEHANIDRVRAQKRDAARRYRALHPDRHQLERLKTAAQRFLKEQGVIPKQGPLDIPLKVRRDAALAYIRETYPELGF